MVIRLFGCLAGPGFCRKNSFNGLRTRTILERPESIFAKKLGRQFVRLTERKTAFSPVEMRSAPFRQSRISLPVVNKSRRIVVAKSRSSQVSKQTSIQADKRRSRDEGALLQHGQGRDGYQPRNLPDAGLASRRFARRGRYAAGKASRWRSDEELTTGPLAKACSIH
jgi:hypothetical protein